MEKECIMCQQDDVWSNIWVCNNCHDDFYWGEEAEDVKRGKLKYCPFCGAKIKEFSFIEENEE